MTNARLAAIRAAVYMDVATLAIQKAHAALDAEHVKPELGREGKSVLKRLQALRNDAFALSLDVVFAGKP